jgi:ribosomal-protein-alanine N-acetyltransferase
VAIIFQHFADPEVSRFLLDEPPMTRVDEAEELIRFYQNPEGKAYNRWGMVHKERKLLIGTCGYHRWSRQHRRAEVGYDLAPAYWGQGLMREALTSVFRYGFETMELNRIEAFVHPENARSLRLLLRLGFHREGLLRGYLYQEGRFHDEFTLSLLRREWLASAAERGGSR